jgi:hypothetical protein
VKKELINQYNASLKMLGNVLESCPEKLWNDESLGDTFWRIAYHVLYFTHLYLHKNLQCFVPWEKHNDLYQCLGKTTYDKKQIVIDGIYSQEELTEFVVLISQSVEKLLKADSLHDESGFHWLKMNRAELHIYNIRHCQHHAGQLVERLHKAGVNGIKWEGMVSSFSQSK